MVLIKTPVKFYALEKPIFILDTQKYSSQAKCCPVKVNTIEEPNFLNRKTSERSLPPVKFYAVEEPIFN